MMKKFLHVFVCFFALYFFSLGVGGVWAVDGTQKWAFETGGKVDSSPAIGADGTAYVESGASLYAIKPDGTQKWSFDLGFSCIGNSSPAIGIDGTIYVGSGAGLYAIKPDGAQKWSALTTEGSVGSAPAIGSDGTIYVGLQVNYQLCAVKPDGAVKWCFYTGYPVYTAPAIGSDGTIYVQGGASIFFAINPEDGSQKWVFDNMGGSSPAIGPDDTVYVGSVSGYLYAINPENGTQKWAFNTEDPYIKSSPAIGADGTIYVLGGLDGNLFAINPDGTEKWAFKTGGGSNSSPAIGADGTIYVGSEDNNIYAINPNGTQKWFCPTGGVVNSSPAIGPDGTIYVGSDDNNLYAINGSSGGLAHTGWPMFHRNLRHTGSNESPPVPDIKANGHDGSISVSPTTVVSITVSLNAGSFAGQNADWWLVEKTPSGAYNHYDLSSRSMVSGVAPTHQGALFTFGTTHPFDASNLTVGNHVFYFGVDLNMSGTLDMDSMYHDIVNVNVQ